MVTHVLLLAQAESGELEEVENSEPQDQAPEFQAGTPKVLGPLPDELVQVLQFDPA